MSRDPHYDAVMQEMNNPNCHPFMTAPFDTLVKPRLNEDCWNIWVDRSYRDRKDLPYTKDRIVEEHSNKVIMELGFSAGIGTIIALIFSCFKFALGTTINWIILGFSRNKSNQ